MEKVESDKAVLEKEIDQLNKDRDKAIEELKEAIACYASRAGEKLREQGLVATFCDFGK